MIITKKKKKRKPAEQWTLPTRRSKEWKSKKTKRDKYYDLARELKKKLWNMKVMVVPVVIGTLGTIPEGLVKELKELEIDGRAVII